MYQHILRMHAQIIQSKLWQCTLRKDFVILQVRELCEVRDRRVTSILNKEESYTTIEFVCTYNIFTFFLCVF